MKHTRIGTSELEFSAVGLGCAQMGQDAAGWGMVDDNESIATIHAALDCGINWIDTSPNFGGGHAESVVGRALQDRRGQACIVGRCGTPVGAGGVAERDLSHDSIMRECEQSLRRLRTETIDLYLCQAPDARVPLGETIAALELLMRQGKVRAIGAVDFGCDVLNAWRGIGPLHAIMTPLSILEPESLGDLVPFAASHQCAVLACSPLCRGLLSGKYDPVSRFADLRARDSRFLPPKLGRNCRVVESLRVLAARRERPLTQLAVTWVLAQAGVVAALVGAKRPSQIREFSGLADWKLLPEELEQLAAATIT